MAGPAGLIDVAPTILDFLNIPSPPSFVGTSILRESPAAVFGETFHCHDSFGWSPLLSLRMGGFKYIQAPRSELYNVKDDPGETRNLVRSNPGKAAAMRDGLNKLLTTHAAAKRAEPAAQTDRTRAVLGSLGYLAAGPGLKRGTSGADPKDKLAEFQLYESAMVALYNRKLEPAASMLRRLIGMDPGNTLARRDLGSVYLEQKRYEDAAVAFRKVLETAPGDYVTNYELGVAAARLGRKAEAEERLRAACRIAPSADQCRQELKAVSAQP
jgi:tetratricopeptide (TPR) repeat protein